MLAETFAVSVPAVEVTIVVFAAILPAPSKTTSKGSKVSTSLTFSIISVARPSPPGLSERRP
jgi:hypothetical protein